MPPPFSARPLLSRLADRVIRRDLLAHADRTEVVHGPERRWAPPAISLPDDPDRIIACTAQSSPELERERLAEGDKEHGPTLVRSFSGAVILDGGVYTRHGALTIRSTRRRVVRVPRWEAVDDALLCSSKVIDRYFGHWPTDGLPLELLAAQFRVDPVTIAKPRWLHEADYRALTGLHDRPVFAARFGTLRIADDRGLNGGWLARMEAVRAALGRAIGDAEEPRRPVFLARGSQLLGRSLANEAELTEVLAGKGFTILRPEEEDARMIARTLRAASLVVAVEGSAQTHVMLAAQPGTPLVSIMPPRQFNTIFKPIADALHIPWAFTVADDQGQDSFHQPAPRLLRLLDRL